MTLVGFSYGGFVVAVAAARLGDRVTQVIYLDAFVPQPGRSFFDLLPEPARAGMTASATPTVTAGAYRRRRWRWC